LKIMIRRLNKVLGVLAFLLFIGGTILIPAFHRTHCTDQHATHDATTCPICHFVNSPTLTTSPTFAPIAVRVVFQTVFLQISSIPIPFLRDATQARAPPLA
jgi:hypothetical protein